MNYVLKIKKLIFSQSMASIYANLICLLIFVLAVSGSIWQGYYNIDPHHWGLMLSNAKDLYDGKLPYQYIFIQYGFLTTAIHALAYGWGGGNLISIISITAIAYAIGLLLIYRVTFALTGSIKISLYALITCFLIHPIAIYPWSNYIAFPFFVYGMLILIKKQRSNNALFLSGLSFGLAILSRESSAPAIILILISSALLMVFKPDKNIKNNLIAIFSLTSGLLLPVVIFGFYLSCYGLWPSWYNLSWLLPSIYVAEVFPWIKFYGGLGGPIGLFKHFFRSAISLDFRWIFLGIVVIANLYIFILMIGRRKRTYITPEVALIAIATLLLLSGAIHINEIFRLATGSMVGVATLYVMLAHLKLATPSFIFIILTLGSTLTTLNSGNYFFPSNASVKSAQSVTTPLVFYGQRWQKNAIQYYQQIDSDLKKLKNSPCDILFHYNDTRDAFLQILSPYSQYQVAPFGLSAAMSAVRPDLDFKKKIATANEIIIFQMIPEGDFSVYEPQEGFIVYRHYYVPFAHFIPSGNILVILAPSICKKSLEF